MSKVAIIGGGIAGSSIAIYLQNLGVDIKLFEKRDSLLSGPPMCHLHAGGNLYPDIDDFQRIKLLKESIEFLRFYPHAVDFRPTIIAVPKIDENDPEKLLKRAKLLQEKYKEFVQKDKNNMVLKEPENYVKAYYKEDILRLKNQPKPKAPKNDDDWIISFSKIVDIDSLKYPILLVQEYGLNIFRLSATAEILIKNLYLKTEVIDIKKVQKKWIITYKKDGKTFKEEFDYIINAAGFESGKIDDKSGFKKERLVEFKAAYITKFENDIYPEIIFLGKRGSKKAMAQFTPYYGGYVQLHGMTKDITLFENGLIKNPKNSSYPKLPERFLSMIFRGWEHKDIEQRTKNAIDYISRYIPTFKKAKLAAPPLYGAQQIPGDDPSLRAADVSFEDRYARCEIVKASSILAMADSIVKDLAKKGVISKEKIGSRDFNLKIDLDKMEELAKKIAKKRGYPEEMAKLIYPG